MKGQSENLTIYVKDPATDELIDVQDSGSAFNSSSFSLINIQDDTVLVSEPFGTDGTALINHPSAGIYQYNFSTVTYPDDYIASFRCVLENEVVINNIFVKSEPSVLFARAAELRVQVDKARKAVADYVENMDSPENEPATKLFFGYDDKHLIFYLDRGAQMVNAVPPYTIFSPYTFPWSSSGTILIDAAVIAALESQGIFAIDTDYNYSLGGNSLVIDHFTKLNSFLTSLIGRFDKEVVRFKQQFRSKGLVMFQWMPGGVRAARQLNAMPSGFWSRMLSSAFV
jgi:hypothetical protein